jgi:hypothetical protein
MSDYNTIPNQIAETMAKAGHKLNDAQYISFAGCMGVWQDKLVDLRRENTELENEKTTLLKCHYNVCWELVELEKALYDSTLILGGKIQELEKERDEFKDKSRTLDNQLHELYHAMELISKIATVVPRDTAILEVINCYRTGELLEAHNLEQRTTEINELKLAVDGNDWEDSELQTFLFHRILELKALKESR